MRSPRRLPAWAEWSAAGAQRPWTVGIEEEVLLVDPGDGTAANRSGEVVAALPPGTSGSLETHACVVEVASRPHATVAGAVRELRAIRGDLAATLDGLGLAGAVAGTHPWAGEDDVERPPGARYRDLHASLRGLARREPTCALHVHVAMPGPTAALRAFNGLRRSLPLLLALSANSPFWRGHDSGLAAIRVPILSMFPRFGIPRTFHAYPDYVEAIDLLIRSRAIPDPSFVWWDVRLQPRLGTVEVRVMDGQTRTEDTAALAALVQCLARRYAGAGTPAPALAPEALEENRFLAARDGIAAQMITPSGARERAQRLVQDLIAACRPFARELRCEHELVTGVGRLVAEPGYARQLEAARTGGPRSVVAMLVREFGGRRGAALSA